VATTLVTFEALARSAPYVDVARSQITTASDHGRETKEKETTPRKLVISRIGGAVSHHVIALSRSPLYPRYHLRALRLAARPVAECLDINRPGLLLLPEAALASSARAKSTRIVVKLWSRLGQVLRQRLCMVKEC
jgi:hypothetical protein